jgi:hypothetical protein
VAGALLLVGALAGGCGEAMPPEAEGLDHVRPALRFALDVPDGWTVRELGGDVVLEAVAPVGAETEPPPDEGVESNPAGRAPGVVLHVVVVERAGLSDAGGGDAVRAAAEAWADAAIAEATELRRNMKVVEREEAALADGRPALRLVLENPRGLDVMEQRMLLAVTDRYAYGLMATGTRKRLAEAEDALAECFETFVVW